MTTHDRLEHFRSRYTRLRAGWLPATEVYQRHVASVLRPEYRVLDLGCGRGGITERLHTTGRWTGVDADWQSVHQHRVRTLPRACAPAQRLPFPAQTFHVIIASWVLEHLSAPDIAFREIARVLRPGGFFFFLTPNIAHPLPRVSQALARLRGLQSWAVSLVYGRAPIDTFPIIYQANSISDIGQLVAQAGLRLTELHLIGDPTYFAWNEPTLIVAAALHEFVPVLWKVHLVGQVQKPGTTERQ